MQGLSLIPLLTDSGLQRGLAERMPPATEMNIENLDIARRRCRLLAQDAPRCLLAQPLGAHENDTLPNEMEEIAAASPIPFVMAAFEIDDWERDLMPWGDPAVSKRPEVGTGTVETLRYLLDGLLPWLKERHGEVPVVLGGYSLAGLFSLWAAREASAFTGIAAASPSVWIQDWPEYAETHPLQARQVYLSLGEREEKTRNRAIAQVGGRIRNEQALLEHQLGAGNCVLEWNAGGHFVDCEHRLARAFIWNLRRLG
ncbi:MAG: hypothetical protein IKR81_17310 [Victivallales bacterium]|nr:hypothetical protein [Victivallales bacterium]